MWCTLKYPPGAVEDRSTFGLPLSQITATGISVNPTNRYSPNSPTMPTTIAIRSLIIPLPSYQPTPPGARRWCFYVIENLGANARPPWAVNVPVQVQGSAAIVKGHLGNTQHEAIGSYV